MEGLIRKWIWLPQMRVQASSGLSSPGLLELQDRSSAFLQSKTPSAFVNLCFSFRNTSCSNSVPRSSKLIMWRPGESV